MSHLRRRQISIRWLSEDSKNPALEKLTSSHYLSVIFRIEEVTPFLPRMWKHPNGGPFRPIFRKVLVELMRLWLYGVMPER